MENLKYVKYFVLTLILGLRQTDVTYKKAVFWPARQFLKCDC